MAMRTLIDGNSIGYSAHGAKNKLSSGDTDTTAIFNSMRAIHKIINDRSGSRPVVLWDGRSWRHSAYADYKANREKDPAKAAEREAYKKARPHIARGFKFLGLSQMICSNWEADDLAAYITKKATNAGDRVLLITGDKDWLQLVNSRVTWFDRVRDRKCTVHNFEEMAGFATREQFVQAKAIAGDRGDNIKGVKGLGGAAVKGIFAISGCVHKFLETELSLIEDEWFLRNPDKKTFPKKLRDFHTSPALREQFRHDLGLVDLYAPIIPKPERIKLDRSPVDKDGFYKFCAEFGFASIIRELDAFLNPFIIANEE